SVGAALPVAPSSTGCERCAAPDLDPIAPRFRPTLAQRPLTFAAPHDQTGAASAAMVWSERAAEAQIKLTGVDKGDPTPWQPRADLLQSDADDGHFVVEIESDGQAQLRFGDDTLGRRPKSDSEFTADYRIGNGAAGNIGAEALAHVHTGNALLAAATSEIRNPLAARGGVEPETMEQVRAYAPAAYRTQKRAVTEADYAAVAGRHPGVQRAIATFRWTGSWHTVFITVDRQRGKPVDGAFEASVRRFVEPFRMAGHDIEIDGPLPVSLEIAMHVCADPAYFRADVKRELVELFSTREFADGRLGLFHPDNFTFGQTVYLSPLIAAAQAVAGVTSVQIDKFQRQGRPDNKPLAAGKLELGRLEIARCDNDGNFPEHGVFNLSVGGGK
ncbi:MAG: putative baseplate assembly protein, partial [Candidatus Binatia bacterium]